MSNFTPEQLRGEVKTAIAEMLLEVAEGDTSYGQITATHLFGATRATEHRVLTAMAGRSDATGRQMADLLRAVVVAPTQAVPAVDVAALAAAVVKALPATAAGLSAAQVTAAVRAGLTGLTLRATT